MGEFFKGLAAIARGEIARRMRAVGLRLFGGLAALAGLAFLIAALVTALAELYGQLAAQLIVGGAFVLIALVLFVVAARLSGARRRKPAEGAPAGSPAAFPLVLTAFLYGFAKGATRKRP